MDKNDLATLEKSATEQGIQKLVAGACVVHEGNVLLLKRSVADDFMPGLIELPSGGADAGEDLHHALIREVKEETNLDVASIDRYLGSFDYVSGSGRKTRQFNFLVTAQNNDDVRLNDEEHSEFFWVEPHSDALKDYNISAHTLEIIGKI